MLVGSVSEPLAYLLALERVSFRAIIDVARIVTPDALRFVSMRQDKPRDAVRVERAARRPRVGCSCPTGMTTAATRAAIWSALPSNV
jgi:hypothetical protein